MNLLDRVRSTIAQHGLVRPGDRIVVAVSGGPDSLALLHALTALRDELGIALHVAHLNHGLRGAEADADAEFVTALARDWGLDVTTGSSDVAALVREQHLSVEEAARNARYAFLTGIARNVVARAIAVGHNADDQVETVLMHFLRGAGLAGLRGMEYTAPVQDAECVLVRPLLDCPRTLVEEYCQANQLSPRLDRSNRDTTFFRNRLRHEVLPYLESLNPNLRQVLRHTANALADDYALLQSEVRETYARIAQTREGAITLSRQEWTALPPALQRGTLRAVVQQLRRNLRNIDWTHIEDARRVAQSKETGAAATLPDGLLLVVEYDALVIGEAGQVRTGLVLTLWPQVNARIELRPPCSIDLPGARWAVEARVADAPAKEADRWIADFDAEKVSGTLVLRPRQTGDRFQPAGLHGHTKSLNKYMIDQKIPRALRDGWPLLAAGDRIMWVCGWSVDESTRVTPQTRRFLTVKLIKKAGD